MARRLIISLLLIAPAAIALSQSQRSSRNPKQPEVVVLAVGSAGITGRFEIEPVLLIRDGVIRAAPYACDEGNLEARQFDEEYLKPGRKYRLLFGGAHAGQMTLGGFSGQMPGMEAKVENTVPVDQPGWILATNSPNLGRAKPRRRVATREEKEVAAELARSMFHKIGVSTEDLSRLRLDGADVISMMNGGSPVLVVSAAIERADKMGVEHGLFLVALGQRTKSHWVPELIWHHRAEDEVDGQGMNFVDQIDLDGDGADELIASLVFYENFRFYVYKRDKRSAQWKQVVETPIHGCL